MQSAAAVALLSLLIFTYTAAMSRSDFQWAEQRPKLALFPWGIRTAMRPKIESHRPLQCDLEYSQVEFVD